MTAQSASPMSNDQEGIRNLFVRLQAQSLQADFHAQREMALGLVLKPYLDPLTSQYLAPLPEEIEIAEGYLYADYFPTDGHPSLIEQVRDTITEHVPEEERIWLDPVRHSYMDLLQVVEVDQEKHPPHLRLQSLGDQQQFEVPYQEKTVIQKDRVLLTRLIRGSSGTYLPAPPLVLSSAMAQTLLTFTHDLRRGIEFGTGNFALAEWPEFTKQYGYLLIWSLARIRGGAMVAADAQVTYWNEAGEPFLYAIAVYEHDEFQKFAQTLSKWKQLSALPPPPSQSGQIPSKKVWVQYAPDEQSSSQLVARFVLTSTQLTLETDTANRLDSLKHQLASTFGFSLHFRGETLTAPPHSLPYVDLLADTYSAPPVTVSVKEENNFLSTFLEKVYLDWAEHPSPALKGKTPRQYCRENQGTTEVGELIDQMEHNDLGLQRTGQRAYDYNILRAHIGL
jgi:hypothetical protein